MSEEKKFLLDPDKYMVLEIETSVGIKRIDEVADYEYDDKGNLVIVDYDGYISHIIMNPGLVMVNFLPMPEEGEYLEEELNISENIANPENTDFALRKNQLDTSIEDVITHSANSQ